ncbi:hypothetical protein BH23VER1_BH23VER1_06260 [soil metagenome]
MKKPVTHLLFATLVACALVATAHGAVRHFTHTAEYSEAAALLRIEPPKKYEFNRAVLSDVLRFLADDAGLNYIALPEEEDASSQLVTFSITASPFAALEVIADTHGIALIFEDGIWYMRPVDDQQLIGRTYQIRYNPGEVVTSGGGGGSRSSGVSGGSGGGSNFGGGGGGGQGQNSLAVGEFYSPDLSLNNVGASFQVNADALIEDIEKLLGIRGRGDANIAPSTSVGYGGTLNLNVDSRVRRRAEDDSAPESQVIWNSDSNALFIVATRQQHQLVDAYLESIDRPQPLIAVEVKFFESGQDPRKAFGIDWSGVLSDYTVGVTGLDTQIDLNDVATTALYPQSAIFAADAAQLSLKAIVQDNDTRTTSYPRVLTKNNREVLIQSVVNQPVLSAESSTSQGAGGISTVEVTYLPIGTTINVLPKVMPDGTIDMHLNVTVSSIIGNVVINGNPYPQASSRVYTAPLKLKSGYTAAIAGLDQADDSTSEAGVPFLSKIPVFGAAFRDRFNSRSRRNLMIWITPYILDSNTEGVGEAPVAEVPITLRDPLRHAPEIYENGEPVGGIDALRDVVLWADREQRRLEAVVHDRRIDDQMRKEVGNLLRVTDAVIDWTEIAQERYPSRATELQVSHWSLTEIRRKTQRNDWKAVIKSDFY